MLSILQRSSLRKFCQFFRKWESENCTSQDKDSWWDPRRHFFSDYKDYIENATLLEYDLSNLEVLYPKNFKQAHDLAYSIIKDKELKNAELPQIARQYESYSNLYSYEDKNYCIMPPSRHNDLKTRAKRYAIVLQHTQKELLLAVQLYFLSARRAKKTNHILRLSLIPQLMKLSNAED